ncbi:Hypothetical protein PHPALM_20868 [Phytophthora palmivora]|uniref:Uncharacterized protein n=1 Tax=Phytophthora palmivora TaxID=4796 RepID=A0A2P4XDT5_9STRA|nr:Hypothetical protein PHPALM_20868 [Phytophthora palmivora]
MGKQQLNLSGLRQLMFDKVTGFRCLARRFGIRLIPEFERAVRKQTERTMVRPLGKVLRDSEVTGRDLSFKSVWKELKGQGWYRKPPPRRSLDDRYFYIRPGGSTTGSEGVHFFRGEEAVLEYYANAVPAFVYCSWDAQIAAAAEIVRQNYLADIEAAEARERARASQQSNNQPVTTQATNIEASTSSSDLVTPVQTFAAQVSTIPTIPVQPSYSEAIPTQASTVPPTITGGEPAQATATHTAAPTTPARRSTSRSLELLATSPDVEVSDEDITSARPSDADEDNDDDEAEVVALGNELLADKDDDLNAMDGGASGSFESIGSGDEAEKDDVETGEYDSSEDVEVHCLPEDVSDDPEETEAEIAAEVLFAENFLQSFGGEDQVLAGNLTDPVLRSMTATGWEDVEEPDIHEHLMSPYEPVDDSRSYPGLRQNYSGPTAEALRHAYRNLFQ